jgi:archaellum component FlaC
MTGCFENFVLIHLRRIDEKLDRLAEDMRDLKVRTTAVETQIGHLHVADAGISGRLDRIEARLDRIERRLDLVGSELR